MARLRSMVAPVLLLAVGAAAWSPWRIAPRRDLRQRQQASADEYVAEQLGRLEYANLAMQLGMLEDESRVRAYERAILSEPRIKGGVVLDVGAGSGVLSVMCALAGARRVLAVERSTMAARCAEVARANGVADVVEVVNDDVANVAGVEVDVIVSEWMGSFLLGESMLPSVLDGAGKGCEIPNFKGSYLGRFPLVSADFWTSDHLSERSRT